MQGAALRRACSLITLAEKPAVARAEAYRRAVDLSPRDYRAWYGLGQTYELLHMPFYALHYFRRATQVPPVLALRLT